MNTPSDKKTIYYDGDCSFCVGIIQKIGNSDKKEIFEPRDITKNALPHSLTAAQAHKEIHLIDADGAVYKNAEAILKILEQYPKWKIFATIGRLPLIKQIIKQILSIGYAFIAANRHRLSWQTENPHRRNIKGHRSFLYQLRFFARERWGLDLRALALCRIGLASVILFDLLVRSQDLIAHYTNKGVLPAGPELPYAGTFIPYFFSDSPPYITLIFLLTATVTLFLLVGYRTNIVTPITWFFMASLSARNPLINNSGDIALYLFLFWGIFLPWGKRYSLDSLRNPEPAAIPPRVLSLATIGFAIQIAAIYLFSGLYKIPSHDWSSGEGVYYMLNSTLSSGLGASFLLYFSGVLSFLSRTLVLFLITAPLLLFLPVFRGVLRVATIGAMMLFHAGLWLGMHLAIFPLVMIVGLFGLLPSGFMNYLERHAKKLLMKYGITSIVSAHKRFAERPGQTAFAVLHYKVAPYIWIVVQCAAGIALIFVLANNIERYFETTTPIPLWVRRAGNELMLSQHWMMFDSAPHGKRWAVAVGHTGQGEMIRTTLDGRRTYQDFFFHGDEYKNDRWREYDQRWHDSTYDSRLNVAESLLSFLCRTWNQTRPSYESFDYVEIFFGYNITPPPHSSSSTHADGEMKSVVRQQC